MTAQWMDTHAPLYQPTPALWRELDVVRIGMDFLRLRLSRLPRGNAPINVLPGFLTTDASTIVLRSALARLGHRVEGWGLGRNRGDVRPLVSQLTNRIQRRAEREQEPVVLVGWSLGGYLAREIAREIPEHVDRVFTLASPVVGGPKYTTAATYYNRRGIDLDALEREVAERDQTHPLEVPVTAFVSRKDAIVCPAACIDWVNEHVEHVEVDSSHFGFGFHREVIAGIAERLPRKYER